ncbi:MAG: hypothetical protein AAF802_13700 [Planctomycetota bacterium]
MSKLQLLALLAFLAIPCTAAMTGCGAGTETTVVDEDPEAMSDDEYENESMGDAADDEAQN